MLITLLRRCQCGSCGGSALNGIWWIGSLNDLVGHHSSM